MRAHVMLAGLFVVLAATCGEEAPPAVTEDKFCDEKARTECALVAERCGVEAAACEMERASACRSSMTASRAANRTYSTDGAGRCLRLAKEVLAKTVQTVAERREWEAACSRVYLGSVAEMGACKMDVECAQLDLVCDKGKCGKRKVVAAGASCAASGETCPAGQHCSAGTMCKPNGDEGAGCSRTAPCAEGLSCTGADTGMCIKRLATGADCTLDDACQSSYCDVDTRRCAAGVELAPRSPHCIDFGGGPFKP